MILLINFLCAVSVQARSVSEQHPAAISCEQITLAKPGVGSAYQGTIKNEDYGFSAEVPAGLTGWSGVDQNAPFHGFTIFLNSQANACINFELHMRLDENDALKPLRSAKSLHLGDAQAWQSARSEKIKKVGMTNISTLFSFKRGKQIFDGNVILISPVSQLEGARRIYDKFIAKLVFSK